MRVIAGKAKGRKLKMRDELPVRPTSDKVKGAVFNILGGYVPDGAFLDLFAGSGSIGIEAWSRGAAKVVFAEKDRRVMRLLKDNLQMVGFLDAECINADFRQSLRSLQGRYFDVIFIDPPYQAGYYDTVLQEILSGRLATKDTVVCLEHPSTLELQVSAAWRIMQCKTYGDTALTFLKISEA